MQCRADLHQSYVDTGVLAYFLYLEYGHHKSLLTYPEYSFNYCYSVVSAKSADALRLFI